MMPVLLVVGGRDPMLDSAESHRRLERAVPRLTVRFLPDAGHILLDQTAPVLSFLQSAHAS